MLAQESEFIRHDRFWEDPDNIITAESLVTALDKFGEWHYFEMDPVLGRVNLFKRDVVCDDPFTAICTNISDESSGIGDWAGSYVSDGYGRVSVSFNTFSVPDQLIVLVNGVEVANSGFYSSRKCPGYFNNCTVEYGCAQDYTVDVNIGAQDQLDLIVYANNCSISGGTQWDLSASCQQKQGTGRRNGKSTDYTSEDDLDESGLNNVSIHYYPNPVSEVLTIQSNGVIPNEISIISATGKQALNVNMSSNSTQIDVTSLESGVYIAKAVYDTYIDTQVIVVER